MKKLITLLCFLTATTAWAQMPYNVSVTNQAYSPLTGGTVLNTAIWDDTALALPLGFNFDWNGSPLNMLYLMSGPSGVILSAAPAGITRAFLAFELDLIDRGAMGAVSRSPIRYMISGAPGNRIFKVEIANAGFYNEMDIYNSLDDSLGFQFWIYEGTNVVEYHYGPSRITHPNDYFGLGSGPLTGYITGWDIDNDDLAPGSWVYLLAGSTTAPTLDSTDGSSLPSTLSAYPASGVVYRFTPKSNTSVGQAPALAGLQVYPTYVATELQISQVPASGLSYRIVSLSGADLGLQGQLQGGHNTISTGHLPAGMYLLQLQGHEGQGVYRFVKQ